MSTTKLLRFRRLSSGRFAPRSRDFWDLGGGSTSRSVSHNDMSSKDGASVRQKGCIAFGKVNDKPAEEATNID